MFREQDVPSVGGPLVGQAIGVVAGVDHATLKAIVDAGIVVGDQHAETLTHLQREGLRLEFLGMAFGEGELAFESENLRRIEAHGAGVVPERRLARGRRDADSRGSAVYVVGKVGGFRVAGKRANAAQFRLRKERIVRQPRILQKRGQRARAAAEAKGVDG